jgi:hypothetical protein
MCTALCGDATTKLCLSIFPPTIRHSILHDDIYQPTIRRSTLPADITTYYLLRTLRRYSNFNQLSHDSVWRCYNQLSSVLCLPIFQPIFRRSTLPIYPLCRLSCLLSLAVLQSSICSVPLGLSILQPNFLCTLLHCVCRHYNRLSTLLRDRDGILF